MAGRYKQQSQPQASPMYQGGEPMTNSDGPRQYKDSDSDKAMRPVYSHMDMAQSSLERLHKSLLELEQRLCSVLQTARPEEGPTNGIPQGHTSPLAEQLRAMALRTDVLCQLTIDIIERLDV